MPAKATKKPAKKPAKRKTAAKKAVKKTVKKSTAKRTPAKKKTAKRTTAKTTRKRATRKAAPKGTKGKRGVGRGVGLDVYKLAENAPSERYFILANGRPVKHVKELAEIMDDIDEHIFAHHVTPEKNDFQQWVRDVFKDLELAKKMLKVKNRQDLKLVIYKHVAHKAFKHKP